MALSERIARLRQQSLDAVPTISAERAVLLTRSYRETEGQNLSPAMRHALAFQKVLEEKTIWIGEGELIVGERGPRPKATPTYPEVCCHTAEDLDTLHTRPITSYKVPEEDRRALVEEVLPYWQGRTQRERIFAAMEPEWLDAFEAGVFTEFMEQRAPGHTVLDDKIYRRGLLDFRAEIDRRLEGSCEPDQAEELRAMRVCIDAVIRFAERHAELAERLAEQEPDPARRGELLRIAANCRRVPAHAPRDLWEALQMYWFIHLGVITEYNTWDSFNPGRLDQHLWPFYERGLAEGTLTEEQARELLQAFWVKFNNQPAPPKVGVTAQESGTYTDFCLINVGGVKPDGSDAVNPMTYLILDVIEEMRLLQPSSMVQISKKNPDRYIDRALRIVRTGFGQPSLFNTDAILQELLRQGKDIVDARCGGASGCVEAGAFGKEAYILTGYLSLPKVLEIALNDGVDPLTGKRLGPSTGDPRSFETFDELFAAFETQLRHFVDVKIRGNDAIERLYAEHLPAPFLSVLVDDCIAKGKDYHAGGARYNTSYIQGVGLGTITDSLAAIRCHVYQKRTLSMGELLQALATDFEDNERLRLLLVNRSPKYGNDDEEADELMRRVFEAAFRCIDGRPNQRGGRYGLDLLPTTSHVYFGKKMGASADGRKAHTPLSEGVSPVQGADRKGPTAVIRSVAKIDHVRTGGTLLNQKFTPDLLRNDEGIAKLRQLVRTYFSLDGHHIQFNVVSADTLRAAQKDPESYRGLIVRVAGYSDYFHDIGPELQEEIIRRTEQVGF
ncbi:MAG TPA: formate C-acetyltransferase/glycerol dehydratase family glycyl radical enzyme [Armatimonadetes bacterium]|nr:formate C-acetyltransferase/glycerol dehydratase family glycyl radical enzyme [Armatimonadota bacterium]